MSSSKSISREIRKILYGSASLLAGLAMTGAAQAQDTAAQDDVLEEVVVKGIRASMTQSLQTKRSAITVVDAITAEDVGKFPDKNLAEALQRVPGVSINKVFGEGERVNLRGTAENLTRTLYNGHALATADWFILDQLATTRSFNYLMLPADLIGQVIVEKTPTAAIEEGGIGGTINVTSRNPLDLEQNAFYASVTGAYTELADEFDPQAAALYSWKNDDETVGLLLGGLYQERNIRRDGVEVLGYFDTNSSPTVTVLAPALIGSALFQQERIRTTGNAKLQLAPSDALDVTIEGLYSKFDADNINENFLAWGTRAIGNGGTLTNATMVGDTAVAGRISSAGGGVNDFGVVYDAINRFATAETRNIDVDTNFRPSDKWGLHFRVGYTDAEGNTDSQPFVEFGAPAVFDYDLRGNAPAVSYVANAMGVAVDPTDPTDLQFIFSSLHQILNNDEETYVYADATRELGGLFESLTFGAKYTDHSRELIFNATTYGGFHVPINATPAATFAGGPTPSDFLDNIASSGTLTQYWEINRDATADLLFANLAAGPGRVIYPQQNFSVDETAYAAYVMGNLEGENWRGNVGVRYVMTEQTSGGNLVGQGGGIPNPFGEYTPISIDRDYDDVLPSVNFAFDLSDELVLRLAAAKVMTRPDFTDIAPRTSLNPGALSGNSGNPDLDPYRANQADAAIEWYMDADSVLALGLYYKDIKSFITDNPVQQNFNVQSATSPNLACTPVVGQANTFNCPFTINQRSNGGGGEVKGAELSITKPIFGGFGVQGNYTYTDAESDAGDPLPGTSEDTFNATVYFENNWLSTRLAYTYRSDFFVTFDRTTPLNQDALSSLDASVVVNVMENLALTFDAVNLTNEEIVQFAGEEFRPRAIYDNGRIFYVGARMRF